MRSGAEVWNFGSFLQKTHKCNFGSFLPKDARVNLIKSCRSRQELSLELFLSRDGELRDIEEEFSEYVRYCYGLLFKFSFFSLSPCPFFSISFRTKTLRLKVIDRDH